MEFWGVEVECGKTLKVDPEDGKFVHISQVILGESKEEERTGPVHLKLKNDGSTSLLGPLSTEKTPQLPCQMSFDKGFELSHDWNNGSVYLYGYIAKGNAGEPKSFLKPKESEFWDDSEDLDDSEDDSESDEETPKKVKPNKKRPSSYAAPLRTALGNPTHPNKRQRFIDSPRCFYDGSAFVFANFVSSLQQGLTRVKKLLSEQSDFSETLRKLEGDFEELLALISTSAHKFPQKDRFFELIKLVIERWKSVEDEVEQQQQSPVHQLALTPSDYPVPVPSAWVVMSDWHDLAYEELQSIRNAHSCLLDDTFKEKREEFFKDKKVPGSLIVLYRKRLNFLGSSKDDISSLPKNKCYEWMVNIKSFVTQERYTTSRNQHENLHKPPASRNSRDQTQCNWRDEIYEQIKTSRKMHSRRLDEAYCYVHGLPTRITLGKWAEDFKYCIKFLRRSLELLATRRSDLVFISEHTCRNQLKQIDLFVEDSPDSLYADMFGSLQAANGFFAFETQPDTSVANWRDVAYEKLDAKGDKFWFILYEELYKRSKKTWSKDPTLAKSLSELDECIAEATKLYKMARWAMSLFSCEDEYFEFVDASVGALYRSKVLIDKLQAGRDEPKWDPREMIPKGSSAVTCQGHNYGHRLVF